MSGGRIDERVDARASARAGRRGLHARVWFAAFVLSSILAVLTAATLVPHLANSAELVRMRNALLLHTEPAVYEWSPAAPPEAFDVESASPNPLYAGVVRTHALRVEGDDWATALAIGRHLLASGRRSGGAIQSDLDDTYRRITTRGEGYCGDFADVFTGLANVAGVFSRPWAFSFDGFGGHGHIFNEIWDSGRNRWVAIDVFNNMYFTGENGEPLSAIELREALKSEVPPRMARIDADVRAGFKYEDKAIEYYRRGLPEWYMWWGNNVFEYDQSPIVRTLGDAHRALEQLGGVVAGVHPAVRILHTTDNEAQRESMHWLRMRLIAAVVFTAAAIICLAVWLQLRRRAPREAGEASR